MTTRKIEPVGKIGGPKQVGDDLFCTITGQYVGNVHGNNCAKCKSAMFSPRDHYFNPYGKGVLCESCFNKVQ